MHRKCSISQQTFFQALNLGAPFRPEAKPKAPKAAAAVACHTESEISHWVPLSKSVPENPIPVQRGTQGHLSPRGKTTLKYWPQQAAGIRCWFMWESLG